jgi:hypothetical protein
MLSGDFILHDSLICVQDSLVRVPISSRGYFTSIRYFPSAGAVKTRSGGVFITKELSRYLRADKVGDIVRVPTMPAPYCANRSCPHVKVSFLILSVAEFLEIAVLVCTSGFMRPKEKIVAARNRWAAS